MKTTMSHYTVNGMAFIKLNTHRKGHVYSLKFLEKLAGFKLSANAPSVLASWGCLRVCKDSEGSYRKS